MHIFKKVVSLLSIGVILTMSFSSTVFAGLSGSDESLSKKEMVSIVDDENSSVITNRFPLSIEQKADDLINLGIIEGDPDGNLRFDDSLSRAEFAKISCLMAGVEANVSQASLFSDVSDSHWASGYITTAKKCGIINGYTDGTFRPDNNVSYSEAIKMIVSSLGYEPMAQARGGYPAGYVLIARQQGFKIDENSDMTSAITREDAFDFVHYALDVPLMEQTGFGENVEYSIMDGKNDIAYKTLRTNLLSSEQEVYTQISPAEEKEFISDNNELIEADIARYWKRMNYEGEYTYEILSVCQNSDGTDIQVKAAVFDENQNRYINLTLNYKFVSGKIK